MLKKITHYMKSFLRDDEGSIYTLTALSLPAILVLSGSALDTAEMYRASVNFKSAVDATALQAGRLMATTGDSTRAMRRAREIFQANIANLKGATGSVSFDFGSGDCSAEDIVVTAKLQHKVFFGLGYVAGANTVEGKSRTYEVEASSTVGCDLNTLEIALIMDNSGSMNNPPTKIRTLKSSVTQMVRELFDKTKDIAIPDPVRFSLVPFSSLVNVGPGNRNASWMDHKGQAWYHNENFNWDSNPDYEKFGSQLNPGYRHKVTKVPVNRFTLYDNLNVAWKGCVEMPTLPFDQLDVAANPGRPNTLIFPSFAPDGPDNWSQVYRNGQGRSEYIREENYINNYLDDSWNYVQVAPWAPEANSRANLGEANGVQYYRHKWTGKYLRKANGQGPSVRRFSVLGLESGPNLFCTSQPLTRLTSNQGTIYRAINSMQASGGTTIQAGLSWGWKSLSQNEPLAEGRSYSVENNRKIAILMTDGENTYYPINYFNRTRRWSDRVKSFYGAFGEAANQRILYVNRATAQHTFDDYRKAMDIYLENTCNNLKKEGIILYTIAFEVPKGSSTKALLQRCASVNANGEKLFSDAENSAALTEVFSSITDELGELSTSLK